MNHPISTSIDLTYRPATYFRPQPLDRYLLSKVKGSVVRARLQALYDAGNHAEVDALLTASGVTAADRQALESFHPKFMGGNYLPDTGDGEVEIARITIRSTTYDVTSVYASRVAGGIRCRVVDEYEGETLTDPTEVIVDQPLTLDALHAFFMDAFQFDEVLQCNYEDDLNGMLGFFVVESAFYPDLAQLCIDRVIERFGGGQDDGEA